MYLNITLSCFTSKIVEYAEKFNNCKNNTGKNIFRVKRNLINEFLFSF